MVNSLFEEKDGLLQRLRELEGLKKILEKDNKKFRIQLSSRVDISQMLVALVNFQRISHEEVRFAEKDLRISKGEFPSSSPGRGQKPLDSEEGASDRKSNLLESRNLQDEDMTDDEINKLEEDTVGLQEKISRIEKV
jgi:hypothetical protein